MRLKVFPAEPQDSKSPGSGSGTGAVGHSGVSAKGNNGGGSSGAVDQQCKRIKIDVQEEELKQLTTD